MGSFTFREKKAEGKNYEEFCSIFCFSYTWIAWDRFGWSQMPSENSRPNWYIPGYSFPSVVDGGVTGVWVQLLPQNSHLEVIRCFPISRRMGSRDVQEHARILGVSVSLGCMGWGGGIKTVSRTFPNTDSADKSGKWTYSDTRKARVREKQPKRPLSCARSLVAPWRPTGHGHTAVHPTAERWRRDTALSRGASATPVSYALLPFHVLLGRRGLLVLAALGAGFGRRSGAAAGSGQEVGRLEHSLRVLARLHAQRSHAGGAVALAAVGGQEGEAHGVWNAARAQRAPWGGSREGTVTAGESHGVRLFPPWAVWRGQRWGWPLAGTLTFVSAQVFSGSLGRENTYPVLLILL